MKSEAWKEVRDVGVEFRGDKIILPEREGIPMPYPTAISWLQRKQQEEEMTVKVIHTLECSPLDGAVSFHRALSEKYGWTNLLPTPGFFGSTPPVMVGVAIAPGKTIQVPIGNVEVPGIDGELHISMNANPRPQFVLVANVKRKHEYLINEIMSLARKMLRENSIYKGSAIKLSFEWERKGENWHPVTHAPRFMDLDPSLEASLIFGEKVAGDLNIGLFTPIEQTAACRRYGVPLKRGVLLSGPYGTGKTLTANITALKAVRNGWTFIYLDSVKDLKRGLEFAAQYGPAVLFAEDIDRVVAGERSVELDEMLNTLDGIDTKSGEIITVFTTNHIEKINPAMLRMGRLDALIEVAPPDADAAARLVKLYSRGLLEDSADLTLVGERLAGKIPAFIREVTERAKIAAISRLQGEPIEGKVQQADLLTAAHAMETHNALINPEKGDGKTNLPEVFVRVPEGHPGARKIMKNLNGAAENAVQQ